MLEVAAALSEVLSRAAPRAARSVSARESLGLRLGEDVISGCDSPPYDKALMDGYAVKSEDVQGGKVELAVLEEVTAGRVPQHSVAPGSAIRIMTGAPLPAGADCVVMVERTESLESGQEPRVRIDDPGAAAGQNIFRRGESIQKGQVVLRRGRRIRAVEIGLLAEIGRSEIHATPRPGVAVLSTGDELVPAGQTPQAGQIRNSNGPLLCALVRSVGGEADDLGIGRDDRAELSRLVKDGLARDVLVLSGGVSAGVADLVPQVLAECGVRQVFHKVHLKPGKPLWFGVFDGDKEGETLVFGLPGNPVSTLVCFELFVRPAIARLAGEESPARPALMPLAEGRRHHSDRPTWWPARLVSWNDSPAAAPLPWLGSADLATLAEADCLCHFPPGQRDYAAGDAVEVRPLAGDLLWQ